MAFSLTVLIVAPAGAAELAPSEPASPAPPRLEALSFSATTAAGPLLGGGDDTETSGGVTILTSTLLGALTGGLVGFGVALIERDHWARDIAVGVGAGILIGASVGAIRAFSEAGPFPSTDGLGSTERNPVIQGRALGIAGRF